MRRLLALLLLTTGALPAQRPKPVYDPETKDGLLIQHIQQETDAAEKLRYMEQFSVQFPSHPAIAWVYDQLQPAYYRVQEWDQAMRIGALRLAIEPDNLEAATIALRSAEAKRDPQDVVKWSDRLWEVALKQAADPASKAASGYAEFCLYSTAMASPDPKARLELLQHLEKEMPSSKYAHVLEAEYFRIYRELKDEPKSVEWAETGLKADPDNVDMLMFLAELHFRKDDAKDRQAVISYTARAIEALQKAQHPASVSDEEWAKKKAKVLGAANYMGGLSNSLNSNFKAADTLLRAALPYISGDEAQEAAALYHLGLANYRLAEAGHDRSRPVDALKYMRRCAQIKSPFQDQAAKNVEAIKAEYSLP